MEVWLCIVNLHTTTAWNNYYYYADDFAANADGVDSYATVKTAGKYREYKRTEGVSTTHLLRRYNCFF
jgi:glycerol-3-phosphate cytidylyltransferase-like family protein